MSKITLKKYPISQGKDPKDQREGNLLEICHKDFRNFKEKDGDQIIKLLDELIKAHEIRGNKSESFKQQKINLMNVKHLIHEGKEKEAFTSFYRAFPYCMPYRSL